MIEIDQTTFFPNIFNRNNMEFPLISCVCVTRNKPVHLKRAIDCFLHQTYPNKELIIIFEDDDPLTRSLVQSFDHRSIKYYEVASVPKLSLGNLRNLSIARSSGEYFCQWDDDDWYHSCRLEIQFAGIRMNHKPASLLAYWLMYDRVKERSFLSPVGPWAGSVLCRKDVVDEKLRYPDLSKKEDHVFLGKMLRLNYIYPVIMPSLYIYAFHGGNTFNTEHFKALYSSSQELSKEITGLFSKIFDDKITHAEASRLMLEPGLLGEVNYFYNKDNS